MTVQNKITYNNAIGIVIFDGITIKLQFYVGHKKINFNKRNLLRPFSLIGFKFNLTTRFL